MSISLNGDGIVSGVSTLTTTLTGTLSATTIGIGTDNPSCKLHLLSSGGAATGSEGIRLETTQATGGNWISFNDTARKGYFGYKETSDDGIYLVNEENSHIVLGTNGSERARILAAGGLTFNGDTAAANALDDYEEGTFTFTIVPGGGSYQYNYGNTGYYTKIGELVYINAWVHVTVSSAVSGSITFNGLPFTVDGTGTRPWIICGGYNHASAPSTSSLFLIPTEGSTTGIFTYNSSTFGGTTAVTAGNLPTSAEIYINGCYRVA